MKNFCFVKKSLLDRLINVLQTIKVALIRNTFSRLFKSTKMAKSRYDYEIINFKSGIVLNILFQRLLPKTIGKAKIWFFLKSTFFSTLGHKYLIRCFYGTCFFWYWECEIVKYGDQAKRHDFWSRFLLLNSPFLFPPKKRGKGEKNNQSGGQKACLSARSKEYILNSYK